MGLNKRIHTDRIMVRPPERDAFPEPTSGQRVDRGPGATVGAAEAAYREAERVRVDSERGKMAEALEVAWAKVGGRKPRKVKDVTQQKTMFDEGS